MIAIQRLMSLILTGEWRRRWSGRRRRRWGRRRNVEGRGRRWSYTVRQRRRFWRHGGCFGERGRLRRWGCSETSGWRHRMRSCWRTSGRTLRTSDCNTTPPTSSSLTDTWRTLTYDHRWTVTDSTSELVTVTPHHHHHWQTISHLENLQKKFPDVISTCQLNTDNTVTVSFKHTS